MATQKQAVSLTPALLALAIVGWYYFANQAPSPTPAPTPAVVVPASLNDLQGKLLASPKKAKELAAFYRDFATAIDSGEVSSTDHFRRAHSAGLKQLVASFGGLDGVPIGDIVDAHLRNALAPGATDFPSVVLDAANKPKLKQALLEVSAACGG